MLTKIISSILVISAGLLTTQIANAHSLPLDTGTINVNGNKAFLVLNLPISAVIGIDHQEVDENGDGKLSTQEISQHQDILKKKIINGFGFYDGLTSQQAYTMKVVSINPTIVQDAQHSHTHADNHSHSDHTHNDQTADQPHEHSHSNTHTTHDNVSNQTLITPSTHVTVLGIVDLPKQPTQLKVYSNLFTWSQRDYQFKLFARVAHSKQPRELEVLTAKQTSVVYFDE